MIAPAKTGAIRMEMYWKRLGATEFMIEISRNNRI